jgi:hypothetical protein
MYVIIRHFFRSNRKLEIRRFKLLSDAQAWCRDPETSSSTCQKGPGLARTRRCGKWFDGYTER